MSLLDDLGENDSSLFNASDGHKLVDVIRRKRGLCSQQPNRIFNNVPVHRESLNIQVERIEVAPEPSSAEATIVATEVSQSQQSKTLGQTFSDGSFKMPRVHLQRISSNTLARRTLMKEFNQFTPGVFSTPVTTEPTKLISCNDSVTIPKAITPTTDEKSQPRNNTASLLIKLQEENEKLHKLLEAKKSAKETKNTSPAEPTVVAFDSMRSPLSQTENALNIVELVTATPTKAQSDVADRTVQLMVTPQQKKLLLNCFSATKSKTTLEFKSPNVPEIPAATKCCNNEVYNIVPENVEKSSLNAKSDNRIIVIPIDRICDGHGRNATPTKSASENHGHSSRTIQPSSPVSTSRRDEKQQNPRRSRNQRQLRKSLPATPQMLHKVWSKDNNYQSDSSDSSPVKSKSNRLVQVGGCTENLTYNKSSHFACEQQKSPMHGQGSGPHHNITIPETQEPLLSQTQKKSTNNVGSQTPRRTEATSPFAPILVTNPIAIQSDIITEDESLSQDEVRPNEKSASQKKRSIDERQSSSSIEHFNLSIAKKTRQSSENNINRTRNSVKRLKSGHRRSSSRSSTARKRSTPVIFSQIAEDILRFHEGSDEELDDIINSVHYDKTTGDVINFSQMPSPPSPFNAARSKLRSRESRNYCDDQINNEKQNNTLVKLNNIETVSNQFQKPTRFRRKAKSEQLLRYLELKDRANTSPKQTSFFKRKLYTRGSSEFGNTPTRIADNRAINTNDNAEDNADNLLDNSEENNAKLSKELQNITTQNSMINAMPPPLPPKTLPQNVEGNKKTNKNQKRERPQKKPMVDKACDLSSESSTRKTTRVRRPPIAYWSNTNHEANILYNSSPIPVKGKTKRKYKVVAKKTVQPKESHILEQDSMRSNAPECEPSEKGKKVSSRAKEKSKVQAVVNPIPSSSYDHIVQSEVEVETYIQDDTDVNETDTRNLRSGRNIDKQIVTKKSQQKQKAQPPVEDTRPMSDSSETVDTHEHATLSEMLQIVSKKPQKKQRGHPKSSVEDTRTMSELSETVDTHKHATLSDKIIATNAELENISSVQGLKSDSSSAYNEISWIQKIINTKHTSDSSSASSKSYSIYRCVQAGGLRAVSVDDIIFQEKDGIEYGFYGTDEKCRLGYLKMPPGSFKKPSKVKRSQLIFVIMSGRNLQFTSNESCTQFNDGDFVTVELGSHYSIRNTSNKPALVMILMK